MWPRLSLLPRLSSTLFRRSMHVGEIVTGRKARYRLTEALLVVRKVPSVYKAEALADE